MTKELNLAGKDWFTEDEAAHYCGVSISQFKAHYEELGISPRRFMGKKLYAREELSSVISRSDPWHQHTRSAKDRQSFIDAIVRGRKEVEAAARLAKKLARDTAIPPNLVPTPTRPYKPRKKATE
ncbi:hypothetical protein [Luteibacter yeojuensis]